MIQLLHGDCLELLKSIPDGSVGFEVIRREAGWKSFCKNCGDFEKTILRPQLVKLTISLLKHYEKTGSFEVAPSLSSGGPVSGNLLDFKIKTIKQTKEQK